MTTLIPQIHQEAIPPVHIQQLTHKVWIHLSRNKPKEELISMLYPKKDDAQKISDYCSSAGITTRSLHSNETLNVSNAYLTNFLVYDLEKYRQKNKFPWSEAMKWHDRIFHSDHSYSITEQTISTKWSCNYAKINNLKVIGTVYRNSSSSTNNNYCLSRSSPEDPVNLKFRSAHVLHGPMRA